MKWSCALLAMLLVPYFAFAENNSAIPLLSIDGADWNAEETAYIKDLHRKGHLKIATKISSAVYLPQSNGSISGFHYNVLKEFAELANVEIDIQLVEWDEYFYKKGESLEKAKADPNYSYEPTLINNVDLYLDGISSLEWRKKMFNIVKYVPSRQLIITRKDNRPNGLKGLSGKVCAMVKNTSMELNLERLKNKKNIQFAYLYTEHFDEMDRLVASGKADFTVYDSDRAFAALKRFKNLTIAWPISEPSVMGWAVAKRNLTLKAILDKYIKYAQEAGILDKYWKDSYGVTFVDYLKILKLGDTTY